MPTQAVLQSNFTAGELAPEAAARVDLARYRAGAAEVENLLPSVVGGVATRPPAIELGPTLNGAPARLIPWRAGVGDAYMIEITPGQVRLWRGGQPLALAIAAPWTERLEEIDAAQAVDRMWLVERGHAPMRLDRTAVDAFALAPAPLNGVDLAELGNPRAVAFHEDRLCLGGFAKFPQRVRCSRTGRHDDFAEPAAGQPAKDDDPIDLTLTAQSTFVIRHIRARQRALLLFTDLAEFLLQPSADQPFSTPYLSRAQQTAHGASSVKPVQALDAALFVDRSGRALRAFRYEALRDGFEAPELDLLAKHLTAQGVRALAWTGAPRPVAWLAAADGGLRSLTWNPGQEVIGWARHAISGGAVEDLAALEEADGSGDAMWLVLRDDRTGRRSICLMPPPGSALAAAHLGLDRSARYQGPAVSVVGGLGYLDGRVAAAADVIAGRGVPIGRPQTVFAGQVSLPQPAADVVVGLPYSARLVTLRPEAGAPPGSAAFGARLRIGRARVMTRATAGFEIAIVSAGVQLPGQTVAALRRGDPLDEPPSAADEQVDLIEAPLRGWARDPQIAITQTGPRHLEVLGLSIEVTANV